MSRKDRESLLIVAFFVACIALVFVVFFTSRSINPIYLAGALVFMEVFIMFPIIDKWYYHAMSSKIGVSRFIPIWNELCLFSPKIATTTIVLWVVEAILFLFSLLNIEFYESFLGAHLAMNVTDFIIRGFIIVFIALAVVRGIGPCQVCNATNRMVSDLLGVQYRIKVTTILAYVSLFIPIVRITGIGLIYNDLIKLEKLNSYKKNKNKSTKKFKEE
mgnify:CR=1 FL=1